MNKRRKKSPEHNLSRTLFFNELFSANSLSGAISDYIISKEREGRGIPGSFSLGRDQTPTLYMIYQLQEKIRNFQKEPYFEGKAQVIAQNGAFDAKLDPNETQAT